MKMLLNSLFALFLLPALALAAEDAPKTIDFGPPQALRVQTEDGLVAFKVELAKTDEQRARGLMYRKALADEAGMLFDFVTPQPVSFWMKNTLIPLDMLFLGDDGHILSIARNARPKSLRHIPSGSPARAVLEIGGGQARKLGIGRGDLVRHAIFGNLAEPAAAQTPVAAPVTGGDKALPATAEPPKSADE